MEQIKGTDFISSILTEDNNGIKIESNIKDYSIRLHIYPEAENIIDVINNIYGVVNKFNETTEKKATIMIDLKNCNAQQKVEVLKYALQYDDLEDPLMLLNILNLVKVYNTLDDSYFESKDIYVNSVEELLDLKLAISKELKAFSRRLSVYFLSILKSYNKLAFTPADEHIALPKIYESIILATDLLTLSGIFAKINDISTSELTYIDNSYVYMTSLISNGALCADMLNEFLNEQEVQ